MENKITAEEVGEIVGAAHDRMRRSMELYLYEGVPFSVNPDWWDRMKAQGRDMQHELKMLSESMRGFADI